MSPYLGFWQEIPRPIVGLSPMDGVTDFACRYIMARHGGPDLLVTEFVPIDGILHAPERVLKDFEYHEIERPIVAQVYGSDPQKFYQAAQLVCELGFDGLDINMGCPAKKVVQHNCGARLITLPELALEIIRAVRSGIEDWAKGQALEKTGLPGPVIEVVREMNRRRGAITPPTRRLIPYSVKTRLGFDSIVIERWVETLLAEQPAVISIHGRTLKQMYRGAAEWSEIGKAVAVARGSGTLILGNGDLRSLAEAARRIRETGVHGVLIGRGSLGNPWIFGQKELLKREWANEAADYPPLEVDPGRRFQTALEHARYFESVRGEGRQFRSLSKHLASYLRGIPEASAWRLKALAARNARELEASLAGAFLK